MSVTADPGSFRDPASRVVVSDDEVYRLLNAEGLSDFELLAASRCFRDATASGRLVATERAEPPAGLAAEGVAGALRHERVPFVSYPYEWSFEMLKDAALLTLQLLDAALDDDLTLKDGSSYNVQFVGSRATFIDVGSFEKLRAGEPWYGYRQFCEMFLYPLMLQAYKGASYHPWLRGSIEGISVTDAVALMSRRDYLRKGVFKHVYLHAKLQGSYGDTRRTTDVQRELKKAGFRKELVKANVRGLIKLVSSLKWSEQASEWSDYRTDNSYTDDDTTAKAAFVDKVASQQRRRLVWDLGANDGRFSRIAAEHADLVLAADSDHLTVDRLYRDLRKDGDTRILPLVVDLASPSPGLGWRGAERRPLDGRGHPDLILALAVVHHLAISRNVPLPEILGWFAELGGELVVEMPSREDPQVERLLRNKREGMHDSYTTEAFEAALEQRFDVRHREVLPSGTRVLYHATPRA